MKRKLSAAVFLTVVTVLGFAASSGAVNPIKIDQVTVLAAGGFPYKIKTSGSYILASNLTNSKSTDAIDVTAAQVTIDLNGFEILGPGSSVTTVTGINALGQIDVTVENGAVSEFGTGVNVGSYGIVKNLHADYNGNGISVGNSTVVEGCTANHSTNGVSGASGILCSAGCTISGNTVTANASDGIVCNGFGCLISGNSASANTGIGIVCIGSGCLISGNTILNNTDGIDAFEATTGYSGNVLNNIGNNALGGTSLGNNLCGGRIC